jgi:hypothetical protein
MFQSVHESLQNFMQCAFSRRGWGDAVAGFGKGVETVAAKPGIELK